MCKTIFTASVATILAGVPAWASDIDACLDNNPMAVAPIEGLKRMIIGRRETEMFSVVDPDGLFAEGVRQRIIADLTNVAGTRQVTWCTLLQRNAFSDTHRGEVFLIRYAPDVFIYFAIYAVLQQDGWITHSLSFNTDFAEMREHLR